MRADWLDDHRMNLLLTALMPENRLAMQVSMTTGLRIDDVLSMRPRDLRTQRPTIRERKTHKTRRVYIPNGLYELLIAGAGRYWVFPGRVDPRKHRTRQAVWKDLRRVAKLYRINGKPVREHVSPHTGRKIYAVHDLREHGGDLRRVQRDLNHADPAVTALYAFADKLGPHDSKPNYTKRVEKRGNQVEHVESAKPQDTREMQEFKRLLGTWSRPEKARE